MDITTPRICDSYDELQKYHQDRVGKLIASLKRIVEEAAKQNNQLRINRHGSMMNVDYYEAMEADFFFDSFWVNIKHLPKFAPSELNLRWCLFI